MFDFTGAAISMDLLVLFVAIVCVYMDNKKKNLGYHIWSFKRKDHQKKIGGLKLQ